MNTHLQRAFLLLEQDRLELAEKELRLCLMAEPNNAMAHSTLAICLANKGRFDDATSSVRQAIHLEPDMPFPHYAHSRVLMARKRFAEAEAAIREAIAIDPDDSRSFALLSSICHAQRRWRDALDAAQQGLAIDPEDSWCINMQAESLVKLGHASKADEAIQSALARNPEDAYSHANLGWTLIEQGEHEKAMDHFREALRLEPGMDWARQGIVVGLKSRHFAYRAMLTYFLWMSKLSRQSQWGILIGGFVGFRLLSNLARTHPQWAPLVLPLIVAYVGFVIMSWLADSLFNLVLRLSRFGRLALSPDEIAQTNWVGAWLVAALGLVVLHFLGDWPAALLSALIFALSLPALGGIFRCDVGWPRRSMVCITAGLFLCGTLAVLPVWAYPWLPAETRDGLVDNGFVLFRLFGFGALASQFAANHLAAAIVRH